MFRTVLAAALCAVLWPAAAHALSCAPPHADRTAVESAAAIFEGVVTGDRRADAAIQPGADASVDKNVTFTFLVSKSWKGVTEGETVTVRRNIYWGDGFQMGKAYLVFAEGRDKDGVLVAGICGLTMPLEYADSTREMLQKVQDGTDGPQPQTPQPPVQTE